MSPDWWSALQLSFEIPAVIKNKSRWAKAELLDYYKTFYKRQAAAPICIALCVALIIVHA